MIFRHSSRNLSHSGLVTEAEEQKKTVAGMLSGQ